MVGRDGTILDTNVSYCDSSGVKRAISLALFFTLIPNTKMVEIMDKDLTESEASHEFPEGQTAYR